MYSSIKIKRTNFLSNMNLFINIFLRSYFPERDRIPRLIIYKTDSVQGYTLETHNNTDIKRRFQHKFVIKLTPKKTHILML